MIYFVSLDSYPETVAHVIVKSKRLPTQTMDALALHLATFTEKRCGETVLEKTVRCACKWLKSEADATTEENERTYIEDPLKVSYKPQRKSCPKNRLRKQQEKQLKDETDNLKKPPMKTAMDVVSRILWDQSLCRDDFVIGYLDRILGVVEKDFDAFSWEDIASVDYNTLAIPKHRIQYFKYRGQVVWDKRVRLDDVFGSTGGKTIIEVIDEFKKINNVVDEEQDEGNNENGYDIDSDDDGIEIDTGYNYAQKVEEEAFPNDDNDENWGATGAENYWGPKNRPTHFLALRVSNPDVVAAVANVQKTIHEIEPTYSNDCIIPPNRLHVTLACLGLDTQDDIDNAVNALQRVKQELSDNWRPHEISIDFNDIGNFFHSVLYAQVEFNEKFMKFAHHLRVSLQAEGVEIRDVFEFVPHMTLIKLKRQLGREVLHTRYLDQRVYTALNGSHFGSQIVDNIYLNEMSEDRQDDGFYISPTQITFP